MPYRDPMPDRAGPSGSGLKTAVDVGFGRPPPAPGVQRPERVDEVPAELAGWYRTISYLANGLLLDGEPWAAPFPAR